MSTLTDMSPPKKIVLVLGGSYAGLSTTHYVLKHVVPDLPSPSDYQVVLVSASSEAMCRPACPRALISDAFFAQDKLFVSIPPVLEQYAEGAVRFVHGTATKLDHVSRRVSVTPNGHSSVEVIEYHALVIATGASTNSPLLGFTQDEEHLRRSWATFRAALPQARHIVVAGGGPAGVETAGELGEHLNGRLGGLFGTQAMTNPRVSITLVSAGTEILPQLRPAIAASAEQFLGQVGVHVKKSVRVSEVKGGGESGSEYQMGEKAKLIISDGSSLEADLYIPATGVQPNTGFIPQELLTTEQRIVTNPTTLRVDAAGERVYAIGDVSDYARPAIHLILDAVPILCANIKHDLLLVAGVESQISGKAYKEDTRETQLVPIGSSKGVGAAMGFRLPSWLVWLIKGRDYWLWTTGSLWTGKQWAKSAS